MKRIRLVGLAAVAGFVVLVLILTTPFESTPSTHRPTLRPTFPFPTSTPVPVTSADGVLIETEPGPLFVIVSTVDEHGLKGQALVELMSKPDPAETASIGLMPSGAFAQVLEIRRLPPDYLRSFYLVTAEGLTGWVGDYLAHRTVFVIAFDEKGCACPMPVPLWADAGLTQPGGEVANRSPLRLLALAEGSVQVQVLSDGTVGWLNREIVHESQENEFLKYIQPAQ
jgi:hypothetical protein